MLTRQSLLLSLSLFTAFSLPSPAAAQPPIYFWGLERDCEQLSSSNRQAEKQINSAAQSFALLSTPSGKPLPACQGERCAQALRRSCPAVSGRVLGGQVVQGREISRFRLWLYDLSTGQTAYQDDYIQNPALSDAFVIQAKALIDHPRFGAPPGPRPAYCSANPTHAESGTKGPLYLLVYGDGKHRAAIQAALEQQLQLLGRNPQPSPIESRHYSVEVMQKIVAGQQNARVLNVEAKKDGKVDLFLFDQKTNLTHDQSVLCAGCERDTLTVQVKQAVSEALDHCFEMQCAGSSTPPAEACEPFPDKQCAGIEPFLTPGVSLPGRHIDPTTAKIVKGSLWGLFGASAATAIGLFAANAAGAGSFDTNYSHVTNSLSHPAWAAAGMSVLSLGLAIPATIFVNRAQSGGTSTTAPPQDVSLIQCPTN